jgi:AcrR family transcriptional regulator
VRLVRQRERLFAAAAAVFAQHGYADASAEAISRAAGMSKATFYEHFANKEECILALFDEAQRVLLTRMTQASASAGSDPVARLREGIRAFLAALEDHPNEAQTLLVEIIGAGPAAAQRREGRPAPPLRLGRRRLRDRRRDRRARIAPVAARRAGAHERPAAGDRARHVRRDRPAAAAGLSRRM